LRSQLKNGVDKKGSRPREYPIPLSPLFSLFFILRRLTPCLLSLTPVSPLFHPCFTLSLCSVSAVFDSFLFVQVKKSRLILRISSCLALSMLDCGRIPSCGFPPPPPPPPPPPRHYSLSLLFYSVLFHSVLFFFFFFWRSLKEKRKKKKKLQSFSEFNMISMEII